MSQLDIRRYEQKLRKSVSGFRLRKHLTQEFQRSLIPLLEELPSPTYEDLVDAFGPPEHLAEALLQDANIRPISWKTKTVLAAGGIAIILIICFIIFSLQNTPEHGTLCSDAALYTGTIDEQTYFIVNDPFTYSDSHWEHPHGTEAYQVEISNTGNTKANIFVYYSDRQPPHTFEAPAGETRVFIVNDPRPGEHSVAFNTLDGTLSGTVRVLLSDSSIPVNE